MNRILYIQYTNPAGYPPLDHSSRMISGGGYKVLFLGVISGGGKHIGFTPFKNRKVKYSKASGYRGVRQKIHYALYFVRVLFHVIIWRPKWVYGSDISSCPMLLAIKIIFRKRCVYHEHDTPDTSKASVFLKACLASRSIIAKKTDICILPQTKRYELFLAETKRKKMSFCVWNCPSKREAMGCFGHYRVKPSSSAGDNKSPSYLTGKKLTVHYHGAIGYDTVPEDLFRLINEMKDHVNLQIVGYEAMSCKGYVENLKKKIRDENMALFVKIISTKVSREELLRSCRKAQVGLGITSSQMAGASNKVFEYMACGLPVIVHDLPEWVDMFVKPGYGLACDLNDLESIRKIIEWYIANPEKRIEMGERGRQKIIGSWNYEEQFKPVAEIIMSGNFAKDRREEK